MAELIDRIGKYAMDVFAIKNYAPALDSITDDSAAIQSAIDAADSDGGGVIMFPNGRTVWASALSKNFSGSEGTLIFQGSGNSVIQFTNNTTNKLLLQNMQNVIFRDLTFIGTQEMTVTMSSGASSGATSLSVNALSAPVPANTLLYFGGSKYALVTAAASAGATSLTVAAIPVGISGGDTSKLQSADDYIFQFQQCNVKFENCMAGGIQIESEVAASGLIYCLNSSIETDNFRIGGCRSNNQLIKAQGWSSAIFRKTRILDYITLKGTFYNKSTGLFAWIGLDKSHWIDGSSPATALFDFCKFDEGAVNMLSVTDAHEDYPDEKPNVTIRNCSRNVPSITGAGGFYLRNVGYALIEGYRAVYSGLADTEGGYLQSVDVCELKAVKFIPYIDRENNENNAAAGEGVNHIRTYDGAGTIIVHKGCDFNLGTTYKTGFRNDAGSRIIGANVPNLGWMAMSDETTDITTGSAKLTVRMPHDYMVTRVLSMLGTASSSGLPTVDINEGGTTILSTKLTIDASEKTSKTAATPPVISEPFLADDAEITFDIDVAGTGAKGLKVLIEGYQP